MPGNKFSANIKYLAHKDVNKKKWDSCISYAVNELPYAYSWYLDCMCGQRWDALVLNDYEAVFPLTWNKKAGVQYLYQPYFTQQLGLFAGKKITNELLEAFLSAIPETFRLIEINLNTENNYDGEPFNVKKKLTHHLLLDKPHEKISDGYNNNTQRNLKKAAKANLHLTADVSASQLISLFKYNQGSNVKNINNNDYLHLKNVMEQAIKYKRGELIGVKTPDNKLCAAGFFIRGNNIIINLFPSSNEEGKNSGASFLLIDAMLSKNENSGLIFDFEGSEINSIARFYKGFGAEEVYYPFIKRNNLPWHLKWLKK